MNQRQYKAFTLVEVLIVVVIIGVLAAIVVPAYSGFSGDAQKNVFLSNLKSLVGSAQLYQVRMDSYPEGADPGQVPAGWEGYIDVLKWTRTTPIGGAWDIERDSFGVVSALGVDFVNGAGADRDDAYMQTIDAACDDGNLATGRFRKFADSLYYYIIAEN